MLDTITDSRTLAALIAADIENDSAVDRLPDLDGEDDPDGEVRKIIGPKLLLQCGAFDERDDAVNHWNASQESGDFDHTISVLIQGFSKAAPAKLRTIYDDLPAIVHRAAQEVQERAAREAKRHTKRSQPVVAYSDEAGF